MTSVAKTKQDFFDQLAPKRRFWKRNAPAYHQCISDLVRFIVPEGKRVLEIGAATGELLASTRPSRGVGVDISPKMVELAAAAFPNLEFRVGDAHSLELGEKFDYVIMSDVIGSLEDVQSCFAQLHKVTIPRSRIIVTYYNKLWQPLVNLAEKLKLKSPTPLQNWLRLGDIENLLYLAGFEAVKKGKKLLFPFSVPLLTPFINKFIGNLPLINKLCLIQYIVARPLHRTDDAEKKTYSVTIIVPTKDEAGNIEGAITRVPLMGHHMETIYVDGHSTDGTVEKIQEMIAKYPERDIKFATQPGKGKADAVFMGFDMAQGDILMILDSDLTMPPEDLPKFYEAISNGAGEFINGCRLVYPMESQAMRTLNYFANHFFSMAFTWLLSQRIEDTLCGTKVLFKADYEEIKRGRSFFGDFDPFGDFDLLFGAAKLNLKIVDMPIRYRDRVYGDIKISRFRHGILLLNMCVFAARKIKFI